MPGFAKSVTPGRNSAGAKTPELNDTPNTGHISRPIDFARNFVRGRMGFFSSPFGGIWNLHNTRRNDEKKMKEKVWVEVEK